VIAPAASRLSTTASLRDRICTARDGSRSHRPDLQGALQRGKEPRAAGVR
jgi:hypothetical protein